VSCFVSLSDNPKVQFDSICGVAALLFVVVDLEEWILQCVICRRCTHRDLPTCITQATGHFEKKPQFFGKKDTQIHH